MQSSKKKDDALAGQHRIVFQEFGFGAWGHFVQSDTMRDQIHWHFITEFSDPCRLSLGYYLQSIGRVQDVVQ